MNYQTQLWILVLVISFFASASMQQVRADISPTLPPKQLEYKLPYPGLLPDNPLCFLKNVRDNLSGFFISKPIDKANFALLQSDKFVSASYLLVTQEQPKVDLAQSIFSQSQDYFEEAIAQTIAAKKQGTDILEMTNKLKEANQKHVQILQTIEHQVSADEQQQFKNKHEREATLTQMVTELSSY